MIRIITFVLVLTGSINAGLAQTQTDFHQLVIPDNGIWWNPDMPGTGASMQFSEAGPWLVILFTYDSEGNPVFYTLQDDQLELSLTRTSFGTDTGPNGLRAYSRGKFAGAHQFRWAVYRLRSTTASDG